MNAYENDSECLLFGWQDHPSNCSTVEKAGTSLSRKWIIWKNQNQWACLKKMVSTEACFSFQWKTRRAELIAIGKIYHPSAVQHSDWQSLFGVKREMFMAASRENIWNMFYFWAFHTWAIAAEFFLFLQIQCMSYRGGWWKTIMELQISLLFMKWVEAPVVHFEKHNKSQMSRLLLMPQMSLLLLETSGAKLLTVYVI